MHNCPINDCQEVVANDRLMCPGHWRHVPKSIADAVYREYRAQPHSTAHYKAMQLAVDAVNNLIAGTRKRK